MGEANEELVDIDFSPLRVPLEELPIAIANRIDRDKRGELVALHPGLPTVLKLTVRVAAVTWHSICFLCADRPEVPSRRNEFSISVPPLARTILDSLFTTVFLFDNPTTNTRRYYASGWREVKLHHDRLLRKHGHDPDWQEWLRDHEAGVLRFEQNASITPDEKADPKKKIPWWPNPGKMASAQTSYRDQKRQDFLQFMNEWFYVHLSGDSHLSPLGLARRSSHLSEVQDADKRAEILARYRSQVVLDALTLFLGFLTELTGQLRLEYEAHRLRAAWEHILQWPKAKELYDTRYDAWLSRATAG